jgi:hypothetical protein
VSDFVLCACGNEARYYIRALEGWTSGPTYCGLCDIEYNAGRGKLKRELEAEEVPDRGLLWYREEHMRMQAQIEYLSAEQIRLSNLVALRDYADLSGGVPSPRDRFIILDREDLRLGKYTSSYADLTDDQLMGLLWFVGEFSIRDAGDHVPRGDSSYEKRRAAALNGIHGFRRKPMGLDEVRACIRAAVREPPKELVDRLWEKRLTPTREACRDALLEHGSWEKALAALEKAAIS